MNKHLRRIFLLLITFALCTRVASAQTTFASEEELKKQAAKLFYDNEFEEAYPLYTQLTSIYPKDPNYNYRLGVCMLYASDDKEKPIPFLEFASRRPEVEKEVFFYLARAYHLNYRFDDAIKEYQIYKGVASAAKAEKLMVDRQIEMCNNGKKLLNNLTDLLVIEKKEMSKTDFFRSYDISDIGGKLLVKPDDEAFKTALDKKKKEKSIIYLTSNNNQVFFSSYGEDASQGKDIFTIRKLPTGEWSKPQALGSPVNTKYDEDFPFLHPNGKVLYFCSKGHNSMGGYDIFKTTFNEETNTWNKPVNIDFPINTPDDDILYVTNEDETEAYFSSARASNTGKTVVYHINVERKPIDMAIIKGAIVKNREGQALDVKITVKDFKNNEILGIFNSNASNGVYLINIQNGGKFLFTVEANGFLTQSDVVDVPVQYVFKPMKQEISYETGTDKLIIKNMFDEEMDESSYLLALNFIKEKSKMDVNTSEQTNTTTSEKKDSITDPSNQETLAVDKTKVAPNLKLTNDDIVKIAYADAADVEKEAQDIKEQADVALALANQKNELAQNKTKEAAQLLLDASKMDDNVKKQTTIDEANLVSADADELNQETVAAFNLAKKLDYRAAAKQEEADLSKQYAKDLEAAVKSKNPAAALTKLDEQQKKLDALSEQNNNPTFVNSLKMDADNKKKELDKAIQISADIKQEISDNEKLIANTQADAEKERNDNVRQGLFDQLAGLKKDTEDSKSDLALNETKVLQLQKDYNGIVNESELVGNVLDKAKAGSSETAAAIAATVDKAKLEQEVNSLKNSTVVASAKTNDVGVKNENPLSNNSVKTNVANGNKTSDHSLVVNSIKDNAATSEDYNKKYEDELAAAENMTDEIARENKKVQLYNAWSASINDVLVSKKSEVKLEKDITKKKELNQEISTLEKDLKDKQDQSDLCIAKVEKYKNKSAIVANVTDSSKANAKKTKDAIVNNTNPSKDNTLKQTSNAIELSSLEKLKAEIANAEVSKTELEKENKKVDAYSKYIASSNDSLAHAKADLKSEKDNRKKKVLTAVIASVEADIKEKQTELDKSIAKVKTMQASAITVDKTLAATNDNSANPNSRPSETVSETKQFKYSSTIASEQAIKSNLLIKEYELLMTQANELKKKATSEQNIDDKNADLAKAAELSQQAEGKKIESTQLIATANKTEYEKNQNALIQLSAVSTAMKADDILMAEMMKDETKIYFDKAQKSRGLAASKNSFLLNQSDLDDAYKNEMLALEKQKKAIAIYKKYNQNFVISNVPSVDSKTKNPTKTTDNAVVVNNSKPIIETKKSNNNSVVKSENVITSNTNKDLANAAIKTKNTSKIDTTKTDSESTVQKNIANTNEVAKTTKAISLSSNETFVTLAIPVYSSVKPIPVNEKLPEGLIFKVQIGAFRNPIPQDLFKGMSPITGETTSQGFTRYTAGLFTKYGSADKAKGVIVDLGYKDAFVVAFLNGKRISNTEAMKMLGAPTPISNQTSSTVIENASVSNPVETQQQTSVKTTTINGATNSSEIAKAQNVSAVTGLFYTIQVGVYSQPVEAIKLFNVQPLYSETTPNGNLRYNSGIYNNIPRASAAKRMIIDIGIKDAFVTAYYNGKRISMNEASKLEKQGASVFSIAANMNGLPTFNGGDSKQNKNVDQDIPKNVFTTEQNTAIPETNQKVVTEIIPPAKETLAPKIEKDSAVKDLTPFKVIPMTIDSGIVFKVQIGAFKNEVPLEIANKFFKIAKKGIRNYTDADGLTIYSVEPYRTYEEASASKAEIVENAGIVDAFIVAYKDGVKISVEEAKVYIKK